MNLPQLRMVHHLQKLPPQPTLPPEYACRPAVEADAEQIDALLLAAFGDGWREGEARRELLDNPNVPTTWIVEFRGKVVATASYQLKPEDFPDSAWVHYVGADAAHAGRGLGLFVTWKVLQQAAELGRKDVLLTTDDGRLPAIRTYLKLGFEPDNWHESHAERWRKVFEALEESPARAGRPSRETIG